MRSASVVGLCLVLVCNVIMGAASAQAANMIGERGGLTTLFSPRENAQTEPMASRIGEILLHSERSGSARWPNGVAPLRFVDEIVEERRQALERACALWSAGAPFRCASATARDRDLIEVRPATEERCGDAASCSYVGRIGGVQALYIGEADWANPAVLARLIGYVIGLTPEHLRADRDEYVSIRTAFMAEGAGAWFEKMSTMGAASAYDPKSIMHASGCLRSKHATCAEMAADVRTITPTACHIKKVGGARTPSALDFDAVRNAYAPGLTSILKRERAPRCGRIAAPAAIWEARCAGDCGEAKTEITAVETVEKSWCGDKEAYDPAQFCRPLGKTYVSHATRDETWSSCAFPPTTEHKLSVECGCKALVAYAECSDPTEFQARTYEPKLAKKNWRAGRVSYFLEIYDELAAAGMVSKEINDQLGDFISRNYHDKKFETKMMRMRAGMHAYAHWRRSLDPNYVMTVSTFNKIAEHKKLLTA